MWVYKDKSTTARAILSAPMALLKTVGTFRGGLKNWDFPESEICSMRHNNGPHNATVNTKGQSFYQR